MTTQKETLNALYHAAVKAAHPATCLPPFLPAPHENGRIIVLAGGGKHGACSRRHLQKQLWLKG